jgi:hypothetical protein
LFIFGVKNYDCFMLIFFSFSFFLEKYLILLMYCFIMYWPTDNSDILSLYTCLLLKSTSSKCFRWHVYCSNPHCQSVSDDMSTVEIHIVKVFPLTMSTVEIHIVNVFPLTCLLLKSTLSMCFHWHVYCWNPHCQSVSIDMSTVEIHKYQRASDDMSTVEIHIIKVFPLTFQQLKSTNIKVLLMTMSTVEIHIVKVFPLTCQRLKSTNIKVLLMTCLLLKSTSSKCFRWHVNGWNPQISKCFWWHVYWWNPHDKVYPLTCLL